MSSSAATSGSKASMFAGKSGFVIPKNKSGFVIPKNKLSGSLVPVFGGFKKPGAGDAGNEETVNRVQRKTKWGPDLTQDAAVRKARASAYETRVDQITKQLKSGTLDAKGAQESDIAAQEGDQKVSNQFENEKVELLELERREIIGEILKLNPKYKAPADYKPVMKETKVSIPLKEHPEYNFVSLIFGLEGVMQKRLEKETGAKICVYGTKAKTGEKVEITSHSGKMIQDACDGLYVNVSAESYEKVDEAVAVIETLFTSVLGNLGAASSSASDPKDDSSDPDKRKDVELSTAGAILNFTRPAEGQIQNPGSWPPVPLFPNQTPSSPAVPVNPTPSQPSYTNSVNTLPPFVPQQITQSNPVLTNPPLPQHSRPPLQGFQPSFGHPTGQNGPPKTLPIPAPQTSLIQPIIPSILPDSNSQSHSQGPPTSARPSLSLPSQAESSVPQSRPRPPYDQMPTSNWAGTPTRPPASLGSGTMGPLPLGFQSGNAPCSLPLSTSVNRPMAPGYAPGQSELVGPSPSIAKSSSANRMINPMFGSIPVPVPAPPLRGNAANCPVNMESFSPMNPPVAPGPRQYHSGFTFQASLRPNLQPAPPRPMMQPPPSSEVSPHQFAPSNPMRPTMQALSRPQLANQMGRQFAGNPNPMPLPPRYSAFQNAALPMQTPPVSRMGPRSFPPLQGHNFGSFPPRPSNPMQFQSYMNFNPRSQNGRLSSGGQQVYDPFSPSDS